MACKLDSKDGKRLELLQKLKPVRKNVVLQDTTVARQDETCQ